MGIHNLNKFIKSEAPSVFRTADVKLFKGYRIAIDTNLILYKYFSKAYSNTIETHFNSTEDIKNYFENYNFFVKNDFENYKRVLREVCDKINNLVEFFLSNEILPIFVIDGECVSEKKVFAHVRRHAATENIKEKMLTIENNLNTNDLENDLENFKKKAKNCPPVNKIKNLEKCDFVMAKKYIKNVLKIPVLKAPNEAEKYCCFLSKKKFVAAVYSTDTDCFPFGVTLMITEIDFYKRKFFFSQPSVFLDKKKISQENFVDFCILLGCDFNSKVESLGFNTLWDCIQKNNLLQNQNEKLIESVQKYFKDKDFSSICKDRCREIFLNFDECEKPFQKQITNLEYKKKYKLKNCSFKSLFEEKKKTFEWSHDSFKDVTFYE